MGSLFSKVFLSFWLAGLLLVLAFVTLQVIYGGDKIRATEQRMQEKASTVATLWEGDHPRLLRSWLREQAFEERPILVDSKGDPVFRQPIPPHLRTWLQRKLDAGTYRLGRGHFVIAVPVPAEDDFVDQLFLVTEIHPGQLQSLPVWGRILIAILVIGLVSFGLSSLLTRRIRRLREAAQSMAQGNLDVRIEATGGDEVAALARDFDQMADHLQDMLESQRRLLSDVSHELRSPLARIRVALELAEQNHDSDTALARISKEADELEQLITHVLSLARLESGHSHLNKQPVSLDELVANVVKDAHFEAQTRRRMIEFTINGSDFPIKADPVLLKSAIENVVRNALYYTPEDSRVELSLTTEQHAYHIMVRDHGPGIPGDQIDNVFKPFIRASEARDRDSGGFGLGLAITAGAIEAHGGSCHAENATDGGLIVTLSLPVGDSAKIHAQR
jgi:two-component system sensor histidine kinase CpxA